VDLLPEVAALTGDVGCRALMARHPTKVREVVMDEPGILTDIDTPEALQELMAPVDATSP
jgi:molybdenum cofactor cytidylyltransferase